MRGLQALAEAVATAGCAHTPALVSADRCDALVQAWLEGPNVHDEPLRRQHTGQLERHHRSEDGLVTNPLLNPHTLTAYPDMVAACAAILADDALNQAAAVLLGGQARLHQTAFYDSGPGSALHRDAHPHEPGAAMVAVLVALEDIELDGGPLVLWPGTHAIDTPELDRLGREVWSARHIDGEPSPAGQQALAEGIAALVADRRRMVAAVPKTDAVWWERRTVHGSLPPNVGTGQSRRSFIAHFIAT